MPVDAMPQPLVSVCIANYNGEHMLAECIDSVLAQAGEISIEIIVHDDASNDASVALIRQRYPSVHLLCSDTNVGFCIANNRMASHARGDFLLLLNNDAALFGNAVRTLLDEAGSRRAPSILTLPQYQWEEATLINRGARLDLAYNAVPDHGIGSSRLQMVEGACLWIPRQLWHALGGFPEDFGSIAEDTFLCCAARLRGVAVLCAHGSGYRHRQGASFGGNKLEHGRLSTRFRRRHLSERNRITVLVACTPTVVVWPWLSLHLATLVLEGLLLSLIKRDLRPWRDIYWRAMRGAWRDRHQILSLRARLQATRTSSLGDYLRGFTAVPQKLRMLLRHGLPALNE